MDTGNKGYLNVKDWGAMDFKKTVDFFTLRYMRKHMDLPSTTSTHEEVRVACCSKNNFKAQLRNSGIKTSNPYALLAGQAVLQDSGAEASAHAPRCHQVRPSQCSNARHPLRLGHWESNLR
jgi:hypothetical protein